MTTTVAKRLGGGARSEVMPSVAAPVPAQAVTANVPLQSKVVYFDPLFSRIVQQVKDNPIFIAIHNKWADRQQHGRLAYDAMMHHAAVSTPFNFLVSTMKSFRPSFRPSTANPTERQIMLADFANDQLRRLGSTGNALQGWDRFMEWIAQGLQYGFTLAEMETVLEMWGGTPRIQINRVVPLPQATLDIGYLPREEFGQALLDTVDRRYRCFEMDELGKLRAVVQFWRGPNAPIEMEVRWEGEEMQRLLHFVHRGREGNPFGESAFFTAFYHWSGLYTTELIEDAMIDNGVPFLGISYKTPDGRPSPDLHAQIIQAIQMQDPSTRLLALPDASFESVAISNPAFTEQAKLKKKEQRKYITESMGVPSCMYSETEDSQSDARNLQMVFFKRVVPAYLAEVANLLQWQFAKRLIDANWTKLTIDDYPVLTFNTMVSDDLQASMPLVLQLLKYVDASRLGEVAQEIMPGYFDASWIPKNHSQSVFEKRPTPTETLKLGEDTSGMAQATGRGQDGAGGKKPGTPEKSKAKKAA